VGVLEIKKKVGRIENFNLPTKEISFFTREQKFAYFIDLHDPVNRTFLIPKHDSFQAYQKSKGETNTN
jgi:hypothetical protein